jgi:acetyl esterase
MHDVEGCFDHYVPAAGDRRHPEVSPLHATTFTDLPRALVFTAGFDVLRDEGIEYIGKLEKAGVTVEHVHRARMPHGYITATLFCREARDDIAHIAAVVGQL